jgi:hypothetical protein
MYFVLAGSGGVELIDQHGFERLELKQYDALIFSPGTLHRLINPNGDLELLVVMQNSGLPERGDNVVSFTDEWLADRVKYADAMRVTSLEDAYRRRDRGVEGFLQLKSAFENSVEHGQAALRRFFRQSTALLSVRFDEWESIVRGGAGAELEHSLATLSALHEQGDVTSLMKSAHALIPVGEYAKLGFCGHLNRYFDPATLQLEGINQP